MITTYNARIATERRFLAALFLYPRAVDIERHHFLSPHHGVLFECIREAFETFPWPHSRDTTYDDIALAIILELIKQYAAEVSEYMGRPDHNDHQVCRDVERYFHEHLLTQSVTPYGLDDLVEQIKICPRCAR